MLTAKRKAPRGISFPPEMAHLMRTGHLYAEEANALGAPNMRCGLCEGPTDLLWLNPLQPDAPKPNSGHVLPGSVWGKDIAVVCRCCSRPGCQHCLWRGELVIGHRPDAAGVCQRCGKRVALLAATC